MITRIDDIMEQAEIERLATAECKAAREREQAMLDSGAIIRRRISRGMIVTGTPLTVERYLNAQGNL